MKNKKRIFAIIAVLVVCFMFVANLTASATFRLYEMDFKYNATRNEFEFTSVSGATYYEIRGYTPSDTISSDTGVLLATYTPDTVSTGDESYTVPLGQTPAIIDKGVLDALKLQKYYTLKVYAFHEAEPVSHSVTVTANYCTSNVTNTTVLDGGTFSVTFSDNSGSTRKTYYGTLTATMGGVDITVPEYGADGNNTLQVVYGDNATYVTVNNITGDVVISMTAAEPPAPDSLDTPQASLSDDGESLEWDSVPNATEYLVEVRKDSSSGQLMGSTYVTGNSLSIASYVSDLGYYFARVTACYATNIVTSTPSQWYMFDFTTIPAESPLMDVDYSSVDTCIGESNPLTFIGTGAGNCTKKHIVDENGDGFDDVSYNNGLSTGFERGKNSAEGDLTDLIPKILGAVGGFFVSVLGNMSVAGISLLTIASIACVGLIVFLIVKVFTK